MKGSEEPRQASPGRFPNPDFGLTWKVSPDLLGILNHDGYFEQTNPAWAVTLGWTADDLRSRPFFEFLHSDDLERNRAAFEGIKQGKPVLRFENRYQHKDGGYRWLSWVAVPEGDKFHCSARDVTEEKEKAEALAQRTWERDEIWRVSQDMLLIIDTQGVIRAVNDAWTRMLGYAQDDLVGNRFDAFVDPADIAPSYEALARASATALPRFENRYRHKDGSWRTLAWTAAPGEEFIYCVARDVTQDKALEVEFAQIQERLRQSQKMEAVGQLTGGLAHDFNNLLAGITGSLELIKRRAAVGRYDDLERYVNVGLGAAQRAASLTHRLLAFSRRQTLEPKVLTVNRHIGDMEDLIRRTIGLQIELEVVSGIGLWPVMADASQLENALLNLSINSRDAMPNGGRLTIETANRSVDEISAKIMGIEVGQYVSMCVSDNGSGMTPEVAARAFDPFFTTKPLGVGTGLGLSMIYGYAKQSGGHVRIYSELGAGTMVCLYLPRYVGADVEMVSPGAAEGPEVQGKGQVVLVVDDESSVRLFLSEILVDLGFTVLEAADGIEAMRILQSEQHLDLLITDVGLPNGMNGRQVADAARVDKPELQILFITGYAENAVLSHGHLDPGMHVMTKPFELNAFINRVERLMKPSENR